MQCPSYLDILLQHPLGGLLNKWKMCCLGSQWAYFRYHCIRHHQERLDQHQPQSEHCWSQLHLLAHKYSHTFKYPKQSVWLSWPWLEYPNCRHTTVASSVPQESSQTVPHSLFMQISTLPSFGMLPPTSRSWPVVQGAVWCARKKLIDACKNCSQYSAHHYSKKCSTKALFWKTLLHDTVT